MPTLLGEVLRLPIDDRIEMVHLIWDSVAEEQGSFELTPAQLSELKRRTTAFDENPGTVIPWEVVRAEGLARFSK